MSDETVYFRPPYQDTTSNTFFYEGLGISPYPSYATNPFDQDSRRYQYGGTPQPPTYTPSGYQNTQYYGYNQPHGPVDSRRNDNVGLLNSDLFRSQQQSYSQPVVGYQPPQRPAPSQPYNGAYPVNGFNNAYTQPRPPEEPNIDWYGIANRDKQNYDYGYPAYQYTDGGSVFAQKELDWVDIVNKNFGVSQKL